MEGNLYHSLQGRHNGWAGVSNHQPHDCLLNCLFRRRVKKISKLRVIGLCAGNLLVTSEFPTQRASDAESVSIWWRHHGPFTQNFGRRGYWPDEVHQSTFSSISFMMYSLAKTSICYQYMPSLTSKRRTCPLILQTQRNLIFQWTGIDRYQAIPSDKCALVNIMNDCCTNGKHSALIIQWHDRAFYHAHFINRRSL